MNNLLTTPAETPASPVPAGGPAATLWLLRAVSTVHLLLVLAQPVLAGLVLSGDSDALQLHAVNAGFIILATMAVGGAALLYWLPGQGRFWPVPVAVTMFVATGLQTGFGYARELGLHIPLGVAIVTATVLLAVGVWRSAARRARRPFRTGAR